MKHLHFKKIYFYSIMLFSFLYFEISFANQDSLEVKEKPFGLILGAGLYFPSMKDANIYLKPFGVKFGEGRGRIYNGEVFFKDKNIKSHRIQLGIMLNYFSDYVEENNPKVSLVSERNPNVERPNHFTESPESITLKVYSSNLDLMYCYDEWLYRYVSIGLEPGIAITKLRYKQASTVVDGFFHSGIDNNWGFEPTLNAYTQLQINLLYELWFFTRFRYMALRWNTVDEAGFPTDAGGFSITFGLILGRK